MKGWFFGDGPRLPSDRSKTGCLYATRCMTKHCDEEALNTEFNDFNA